MKYTKTINILFALILMSMSTLAVTNINDTTVSTNTLIGDLSWSYLQNYPSACAANQYVSIFGDTLTCDAINITSSQISDFGSYVNKTGDTMSGNLSMGNNSLVTVQSIKLDTAGITTGIEEGRISWNPDDYTINIESGLGNVIQVGQEMTSIAKNAHTATLTNGQVVSLVGSSGDRGTVIPADASNITLAERLGVVTVSSCAVNADCPITTFGRIRDIDTSAWSPGTLLYLSADGSGNLTSTAPAFPNFRVLIGAVIRQHATDGIVLVRPSISYTDGVTLQNVYIRQNLTVAGALHQNGYTLKNISSNAAITDDVFCLEMEGPTGERLCHFYLQAGGASQFSGIVRSVGIINEEVAFLNNTNRTDCNAYFNHVGETLKIDCNTSTTGADFFVGDDMQVIGDVWVKDKQGEWHFLTREMTESDNLMKNLLFGEYTTDITGTTFTLTGTDNIEVNINGSNTIKTGTSDTATIVAGTNSTPTANYITYQNPASPTLTRTAAYPGDSDTLHVDIWKGLVGVLGNYYLYSNDLYTNNEILYNLYDFREDQGPVYSSGFNPAATTLSFSFSSGKYWDIMTEVETSTTLNSTNDGYYFVLNNGTFVQGTDFSSFTQYNDGGTIAANAYFNIVCGIIQDGTNSARILCVPQDTPSSSYISAASAESDADNTLTFTINNNLANDHFLPLARFIVRNSNDELQQFSNNEYFKSVLGVAAFGSAAGGTNDHSALSNLDYASSGHTGFAESTTYWNETTDINDDEITEAKIGFTTSCGSGNHLYISGNDLACEADANTQLTEEQVEDYVGGMLNGSQIGMTVTYQDATGSIDFANSFGNSIDDQEMTNENFGEFTCTGAEDGCTLNSGVYDDEYIELTDATTCSGGNVSIWDGTSFNCTAVAGESTTVSGNLIDLNGFDISIKTGTLTDNRLCEYTSVSDSLDCNNLVDTSGDCAAGSICGGGHGHTEYLQNIVEDTTPQLGGYLDANGQNIGSTTDEIENVYIGDNTRIYLGDDQDASIYFNGTSLLIVG